MLQRKKNVNLDIQNKTIFDLSKNKINYKTIYANRIQARRTWLKLNGIHKYFQFNNKFAVAP